MISSDTRDLGWMNDPQEYMLKSEQAAEGIGRNFAQAFGQQQGFKQQDKQQASRQAFESGESDKDRAFKTQQEESRRKYLETEQNKIIEKNTILAGDLKGLDYPGTLEYRTKHPEKAVDPHTAQFLNDYTKLQGEIEKVKVASTAGKIKVDDANRDLELIDRYGWNKDPATRDQVLAERAKDQFSGVALKSGMSGDQIKAMLAFEAPPMYTNGDLKPTDALERIDAWKKANPDPVKAPGGLPMTGATMGPKGTTYNFGNPKGTAAGSTDEAFIKKQVEKGKTPEEAVQQAQDIKDFQTLPKFRDPNEAAKWADKNPDKPVMYLQTGTAADGTPTEKWVKKVPTPYSEILKAKKAKGDEEDYAKAKFEAARINERSRKREARDIYPFPSAEVY